MPAPGMPVLGPQGGPVQEATNILSGECSQALFIANAKRLEGRQDVKEFIYAQVANAMRMAANHVKAARMKAETM